MADLVGSRTSRSASLRRPLLGGLFSALLTGAIQAVQIWVFPLFGIAWPSMRAAALLAGAGVPGLFLGDQPLALLMAVNLASWFFAGALIACLIRKNPPAITLWLAAFALADVLCYLLLFMYMTGIADWEVA